MIVGKRQRFFDEETMFLMVDHEVAWIEGRLEDWDCKQPIHTDWGSYSWVSPRVDSNGELIGGCFELDTPAFWKFCEIHGVVRWEIIEVVPLTGTWNCDFCGVQPDDKTNCQNKYLGTTEDGESGEFQFCPNCSKKAYCFDVTGN
jgi:hypothetical protein